MDKLREEVKDQSSKVTVDVIQWTFRNDYKLQEHADLWGDWEISRIRNALIAGVDDKQGAL